MNKLLIILLFLSFNVEAYKKNYGSLIVFRVVSVYDGDTFRVDIENIHPIIGKNLSIRVYGIDTPEIRGKCLTEKLLALKAREHTELMLDSGSKIELRNIQRGKYFRVIADVYINGKSLTKSLIAAKLGYEYHGKTKKDWCAK